MLKCKKRNKTYLDAVQRCSSTNICDIFIYTTQTVFRHHYLEGWAQDYSNSNIFLKPLFRGNLDPFINNANLGAIAHTSNGT